MVFDRLFNIVRSYVNDFVEKKEDEFKLDPEEDWTIDDEWDREFRTGEKSYDQTYERKTPPRVDKEAQFFKDLEMKPSADFAVIKKQYRTLMKKYHPDRFMNNPEKQKTAEEITAKINVAYAYFEKKHGK